MRRSTILALLFAAPLFAQKSPEETVKSFTVAEGLQVELFAAEPMVINPTSMDVDHLGRVWVAEAVNYRRKGFNRPILREAGDRIQVLVDKDGDGKADEANTFYQGQDLYGPLGICVLAQPSKEAKGGYAYRVLVCQSPDILELWDKDGDGKADGPPKKFLTNFGGFDHDHGVHGINVGPDGKLYFTVGDSGVKGLQSADGKGPKWVSNDKDVQKGTVWRCDQDGNNLELIAHNFRNNYECCVNSFGEIWLSDNDDDGNQQTRICHVMPGGNYGYGPRGAGQSHWHEEQPGIVHKTMRTGFGSPTGICFYEGNLLPKKYHGQLLHTDAGPRELRAFHIKPKGAGYELEKENLVTSTDNWFRLSDVCVAPDGSVMLADWYDPGVGGHGMGDWTKGRIYRLTPKGHKGYKVPEVKLETDAEVLATLESPNLATRWLGYQTTQAKTRAEINGILAPALKSDSLALQARVFWAIAEPVTKSSKNDPKGFTAVGFAMMLMDKNADRFLSTAFRMDRTLFKRSTLDLPQFADWSVEIKDGEKFDFVAARELLLGARDTAPEKVKRNFYILAKQYDGQDHFYRAALNIACGTDPVRRDAILADFEKQFPEWNDKVADLVWELRPKSMMPKLGKLLEDPKLTGPQKARIVDILAASDDASAGQAMIELLGGTAPAEVKARAIDNLRLFLPTKWQSLRTNPSMSKTIDTLLARADGRTAGLALAAASGQSNAVVKVRAIAEDDKLDLAIRKEAIATLGQIKTEQALDALMQIGVPQNPLSVACTQAIGNHLPNGPKPLAYQQRALDALKLAIELDKASPELKQAALNALASNRVGTGWLLQLKEQNKFPPTLVADAGRVLRNSPFQGERNKAMLLFPAPGKLDPKKLPPMSVLTAKVGDIKRGEAVMKASLKGDSQCMRCHAVQGVGGNIGPDLSMIGKKGSKENLYDSLLSPSKAIADQYVQWKVETLDGKGVTGLLVAESATSLTLRDANGKDHTFATKDLDGAKQKSLVSLMPDNVIAALTEDELVDLVEYLMSLKTAALTPDSWHAIGPFKMEGIDLLDHKFGPELTPFAREAKFSQRNGPTSGPKAPELGWKSIHVDAKGYIDLAALHGESAQNSATYLYQAIDSPAAQTIEVLMGTDDGSKLYVNGKEVFATRETRAAAPSQNRVKVDFKAGKNEVLLKIVNGNNPHGAYVTILSEQELKLSK